MNVDQVLSSWRSRTASVGEEQFSEKARQRIASLFLEVAASSDPQNADGKEQTDQDEWSTQVAQLGIDEALAEPVLRSELRICQLSLLGIFASSASETAQQRTASAQQAGMQRLLDLLQNLDELITRSADKFINAGATPGGSETSPDTNGKQGKTLQHEIRTPLQGALLTTELMLEDAGHGEAVSADDILAVRKSIETAVGILNDFAAHSSSD